jgi:hypothetical protein
LLKRRDMKTRDKWTICRRYIVAILLVTAVSAVSLTPAVQGWPWDDDNDWLPQLPEFEWPEIEMPDFMRTLRNWVDSVTTSISNALSRVVTSVKNALRGVTTSVYNTLVRVITSIENALSSITTDIKNALDGLTASIKNLLSDATSGIKSALTLSWLLMPFIAVALVAVGGLAGAHLLIKRRGERKKGQSGNDETERRPKEGENKPVCSPEESNRRVVTSNLPVRAKEEHMLTEKELVKEREILGGTRCRYCHMVYDETLDDCPYCGAPR